MNLSSTWKNYLAAVVLLTIATLIGGYALMTNVVLAQGDTPVMIGDGSLFIQGDRPWSEQGDELEHPDPQRRISRVRITENGVLLPGADFDCRTENCAVTVTSAGTAGPPVNVMARTVKQGQLLRIRVVPGPFSAGWRRLDNGRRYVRDGLKVRDVAVQHGPGQPARFTNLSGAVIVSICYGSCSM